MGLQWLTAFTFILIIIMQGMSFSSVIYMNQRNAGKMFVLMVGESLPDTKQSS